MMLPDMAGLGTVRGVTEQQGFQCGPVKREKRPEVTGSAECGGGNDGQQYEDQPSQKTPQMENSGHNNNKYTVNPDGIPEFRAGKRKAGKKGDGSVK